MAKTNMLKKDKLAAALKEGAVLTAVQIKNRFNYSSTGSVGSALSRLRSREGMKIKIVGQNREGQAKFALGK